MASIVQAGPSGTFPIEQLRCAMMQVSSKQLALIVSITMWAFPSSAQRPACSLQKTFTVEQIDSPALRYQLIDKFGPVRFCDPECPSSCRFVLEQEHAEEAFPQIRRQEATFRKIVEHLGLGAVREYSGEQKLSVYREYKKLLCGMNFETQGENHKFEIASGEGVRVEGTIDPKGEITVVEKEPFAVVCPK
jgi:hypothetical protein